MVVIEICVDSIQSAKNAFNAGANRIELCSSIVDGGITPSLGLVKAVIKAVDIPVFVMIRPRPGDFVYSKYDTNIIFEEIEIMKNAGAAGIVVGVMKTDGSVDDLFLSGIVDAANPMEVTFHRAIDISIDIFRALQDLDNVGVKRVLTSGGCSTAVEGREQIREMVQKIKRQKLDIVVVAAAGIHEQNAVELVQYTGVTEVHASLQTVAESLSKYVPKKPLVFGKEKLYNPDTELNFYQANYGRITSMRRVLNGHGQDSCSSRSSD